MNRIILIGNGFDLAHGLKTSYKNFLDDYWQKWFTRLCDCKDYQISDEFYHFEVKNGDDLEIREEIRHLLYLFIMHLNTNMTLEQIRANEHIEIKSFEDISQLCTRLNEFQEKIQNSPCRIRHEFVSQLFAEIHNPYNDKWVDIENEYYQLLSKTYHGKYSEYETAEDLNTELNVIKERLKEYLTKIQDEKITDELFNEQIKKIIFESVNLQDISMGGQDLFWKDFSIQISELAGGMCAAG